MADAAGVHSPPPRASVCLARGSLRNARSAPNLNPEPLPTHSKHAHSELKPSLRTDLASRSLFQISRSSSLASFRPVRGPMTTEPSCLVRSPLGAREKPEALVRPGPGRGGEEVAEPRRSMAAARPMRGGDAPRSPAPIEDAAQSEGGDATLVPAPLHRGYPRRRSQVRWLHGALAGEALDSILWIELPSLTRSSATIASPLVIKKAIVDPSLDGQSPSSSLPPP